ncbi:hypothetical protein [uncultured Marixanthomonas sp.]
METPKRADQNTYFIDYQDTQAVILGITYNFGNQQVKNNPGKYK